ncbi:AaceriAGL104Cp [[Ashbya] aceris (nom. inval.)]|nr:AaceriAGL104Cp [[Ashbya] aceris (nom. inval.)]
MTTEIYEDDNFGSTKEPESEKGRELRWLVEEIVKPQLPSVIDNIETCLAQLVSEETFKMPISNGVSDDTQPMMRGTLSRKQGRIVDFQALVKFPQFHRGKTVMYKMKEQDGEFQLQQIESICTSLYKIVDLLDELQSLADTQQFVERFGELLVLLTRAISVLENPPRALLFPEDNNKAVKTMFHEQTLCESTHHLVSIELVLFKNELMIEFRNLVKVTKRPWCQVNPETGTSFVDRLRQRLRTQRNVPIKTVMEEEGVQIEEPSLVTSLISHLNTNGERITLAGAQDLLNRCVTFDGRVVMECEKVTVRTSDPGLICVSAKLNALASRLSTHYTNLRVM